VQGLLAADNRLLVADSQWLVAGNSLLVAGSSLLVAGSLLWVAGSRHVVAEGSRPDVVEGSRPVVVEGSRHNPGRLQMVEGYFVGGHSVVVGNWMAAVAHTVGFGKFAGLAVGDRQHNHASLQVVLGTGLQTMEL
jgi:hypothetical protein